MWWNPFSWFSKDSGTDFAEMRDALAALAEQISGQNTSSSQEILFPETLVQRVEALERRMEEVHADCMAYLRKGRTAASRAENLRKKYESDDDEDGPVGSPEQFEQMNLFQGENRGAGTGVGASDLDSIRRLIAQRG